MQETAASTSVEVSLVSHTEKLEQQHKENFDQVHWFLTQKSWNNNTRRILINSDNRTPGHLAEGKR